MTCEKETRKQNTGAPSDVFKARDLNAGRLLCSGQDATSAVHGSHLLRAICLRHLICSLGTQLAGIANNRTRMILCEVDFIAHELVGASTSSSSPHLEPGLSHIPRAEHPVETSHWSCPVRLIDMRWHSARGATKAWRTATLLSHPLGIMRVTVLWCSENVTVMESRYRYFLRIATSPEGNRRVRSTVGWSA